MQSYLIVRMSSMFLLNNKPCTSLWVGVTVAKASLMSDHLGPAIEYLSRIEAKVKYISFEPLLAWWWQDGCLDLAGYLSEAGINWVILGAQTKPYNPPKIEWVREIVEACDKAGIPVFLKDNLYKSREIFNAEGMARKIRQELPG